MPSPSISNILGFERKLIVGVGGMAVSNDPGVILTTYSLGSCLGITIYDPVSHTGGLLHVMLPDSSINPEKASTQPGMFVDTGVPALFRAAYELKAEKHRIQICVAGGAQFLDQSGFFNIGQRNYASLCELLHQHGLVIQAEQVGGLVSRTVHLNLARGEVRLRSSGQPDETILFRG
jgi:chemotaxis protein CheD